MQKFVIIVAGGKGLRMGKEIPKQFLLLKGKPILMHSIEKFLSYDTQMQVILVLPKIHFSFWEDLSKEYNFDKKIIITEGGITRIESVHNGLKQIPLKTEALVAIHDGVRPLVSRKTIGKSFDLAQEKGSAVVVVPAKDSLREITQEGSKAVIRANFRQVQTPQTFKIEWLLDAYKKVKNTENITDDASLVESLGYPIFLVDGEYSNIKITTPEDLLIAEALWEN